MLLDDLVQVMIHGVDFWIICSLLSCLLGRPDRKVVDPGCDSGGKYGRL